jgi:hypothetical protein
VALVEYSGDSLQWNVSSVRATLDWEMDIFVLFFNLLYSIRVRRDGINKLWWPPSIKRLFNVSSYYSVLAGNNATPFPWKTKVPLRVAYFAWSATLEKILTMDNLRKRHVIVIDRCCMCKRNRESMNHLLLHCEVACALWKVFFSRFELS